MIDFNWWDCKDPKRMLGYLGHNASDRKLRLLLCAAGRAVWDRVNLDAWRSAIDLFERYADGEVGRDERLRTTVDLARHRGRHLGKFRIGELIWAAGRGRAQRSAPIAIAEFEDAPMLIREFFAPPFTKDVHPDWRGSAALALAESAYRERYLPSGRLDETRLTLVADAFEEAGCTLAELLTHLRSPGPHFRGCWALDLVLGKE